MSEPCPTTSATDLRVNAVGLASMLAVAAALVVWPIDRTWAVVALMAAAAAPIVVLDLAIHRVYRRASTGIAWHAPRPREARRVVTKLVGAFAAVSLVFAVYALAPEYQGGFYDGYYAFLRGWVPLAAAIGAPYVVWLDRYLVEPRDVHWHIGAALIGPRADVDWAKVADGLRGWVIKGFFVPLMFTYAATNVGDLRAAVASDQPWPFLYGYDILWHTGFLVDVVFTTAGYLLTLRVLDTHVRSAEPTASGWVVALVCYQPFFGLISRQYLKYNNGFYWGEWLEPAPALKIVWGSTILLLLAIYAGSTVVFGCRFSNLTHRGIVTGGPYRWVRHPAYVSKCLSFWMIFIPFVRGTTMYDAVRDCTWLAGLSLVYWLRARTEERHLSRDPDYVRYALWMNDHSVLAPLGRWFPFLAYRPPPGAARPDAQPYSGA